MAFHPIEFVKEHPVSVAAVVGGVIVLWYLTSSSGSGSAQSTYVAGPSDAQTQANAALAISQNQAQEALAAANIALQAKQQDSATQLQIATIQAQTQNNATTAAQTVDLANISATKSSTDLANTLAAQVASLTSNNNTKVQLAQSADAVSIAHITAAATDVQAKLAAQVQNHQIEANKYIAGYSIFTLGPTISNGAQFSMSPQGGVSFTELPGGPQQSPF